MTVYEIVKTVELASMPNPALAKDLLERLKLATKVVVAKRKWRVPVLKEFYPKNRSLLGLNVNRGQSIMIRLREGHDQFAFLPWESLLGTLVHELTHNAIGEHSAEFYKTMETVYDEVEASSGSSGSLWGPLATHAPKYNFDGPSAKVGGGHLAKTIGVNKENIRKLAAKAALRRIEGCGSSGSNILGGAAVPSAGTAQSRKKSFLAAEERRRQEGCSVVKAPTEAGGKAGAADVSSSNSSGSTSSNGNRANLPVQWLCMVCLEQNESVLPSCVWCGCAFGSSLDDGGQQQQQQSGSASSSSSGITGRSSNSRVGGSASNGDVEVSSFPLAGLCRRTLYEVRGCACCASIQGQVVGVGRPQQAGGAASRGGGVHELPAVISLIDEEQQQQAEPLDGEDAALVRPSKRRRAAEAKEEAAKSTVEGTGEGSRAERKRQYSAVPEGAVVMSLLE